MVQFKVLSGRMAGSEKVARHFPFNIGRSASADLQVEEDGVWDQHLELSFDPSTGFTLAARPKALASVNGQPFESVLLRNGDLIEIGAIKIRFWLSNTRQKSLGWREWLTWAGIALITALQIALIYLLINQ
ncbi:FHA domain-containing protein [Pedosphaera parvula]|uniref:FHA domain containing protein n=1 Tax=Pedosphaera parvula (strain Ellin514) TaxID=320771 RepID=B9XK53_PEDPL|nr:FHA domain-containing protein [Pedosphaera parvula]EEF59876.1 FHA domain containing protein [Pedosphaera parvula Ellin514]